MIDRKKGTFILQKQKTDFVDNRFLWRKRDVYIMDNHRMALWCWLQCLNIDKGNYVLIHIDQHTDAREWIGIDEEKCLKHIISNFDKIKNIEQYNEFRVSKKFLVNVEKDIPCIKYDNFISLAMERDLFRKYYNYSRVGDRHKEHYNNVYYYSGLNIIDRVIENIKQNTGKCIVDLDLDFFDLDDLNEFSLLPEDKRFKEEDKLLIDLMRIIKKNKDKILMLTISINEVPESALWEKRKKQLTIIGELLNIDIPNFETFKFDK